MGICGCVPMEPVQEIDSQVASGAAEGWQLLHLLIKEGEHWQH